jgi:hypothetical protein
VLIGGSVPVISGSVPVISGSVPVISGSVPVISDSVPVISDSVPVIAAGVKHVGALFVPRCPLVGDLVPQVGARFARLEVDVPLVGQSLTLGGRVMSFPSPIDSHDKEDATASPVGDARAVSFLMRLTFPRTRRHD